MKKTIAFLTATLTAASMTLTSVSTAQAHDASYHHYHQNYQQGSYPHYHQDYSGYRHSHTYYGPSYHPRHSHTSPKVTKKVTVTKKTDDINKALILGIVGLAAGAAIANSVHNKQKVTRTYNAQRRYSTPSQFPNAPARTYTTNTSVAPWTQSWYQYCQNRYRSFNPTTGTYRGYDGKDHFCVVR